MNIFEKCFSYCDFTNEFLTSGLFATSAHHLQCKEEWKSREKKGIY